MVIAQKIAHVEFHAAIHTAFDRHEDAKTFAIDIPIGLSDSGRRKADCEARRMLRGHHSRVFPAPPRLALDLNPNLKLCCFNEELRSRKCSTINKQTRSLIPKIREVKKYWSDARVYEVHPEVSFATMAGKPVQSKKSTAEGLDCRHRLLNREGFEVPSEVDGSNHRTHDPDDVVDAIACAWTAMRIMESKAQSLPRCPERLDGREAAIWY